MAIAEHDNVFIFVPNLIGEWFVFLCVLLKYCCSYHVNKSNMLLFMKQTVVAVWANWISGDGNL